MAAIITDRIYLSEKYKELNMEFFLLAAVLALSRN